ncbi:dihydrofolate reductase family protein [Streptomyces sp. L7]
MHGDDDFGRFVVEVSAAPGADLLGRRTYDIPRLVLAEHDRPRRPDHRVQAERPAEVRRLGTLTDLLLAGTAVVLGGADLAKEVTALERAHRGRTPGASAAAPPRPVPPWSSGLPGHSAHLVTFPVVLGTGLRLFPEGTTPEGLQAHGRDRHQHRGLHPVVTTWRADPRTALYADPENA